MTLEYGIDDYSIASICRAAGDFDAADAYYERSQNVFSLFDRDSGFIRGRNKDGKFIEPFIATTQKGFNEGNATQYFWSIPHSISKLIQMAGGKMAIEPRLDDFMSVIKTGWATEHPHFWVGNEPCFGTVYIYNYIQAPWKTQAMTRRVIHTFSNDPNGLPGDDDVGAMSAMFAFQALGMYPYVPGEGILTLSGPLFEEALISLDSGAQIRIVGTGAGSDTPYIQSLHVNGEVSTRLWLDWDAISEGAEILYEMGSTPNTAWGAGAEDAPPSYVSQNSAK
jgi:predicted alpha-1,2-mannosidase